MKNTGNSAQPTLIKLDQDMIEDLQPRDDESAELKGGGLVVGTLAHGTHK